MEHTAIVKQMFPLRERPYTDRNGQQQVMRSRGYLLDFGLDTVYAEQLGEDALQEPKLDHSKLVHVSLYYNARKWTDKNGEERWENQAVIKRLRTY